MLCSISFLYFCRKDVFSERRATADVTTADLSNFLHPVYYYYEEYGSSKSYQVVQQNLIDW